MEIVYHKIEKFTEEDTGNALFGELVDAFRISDLGPKKVLLILHSAEIARTFYDMIGKFDGSVGDWMIMREPQPCQINDKITYRLPNGMEVRTLILDN